MKYIYGLLLSLLLISSANAVQTLFYTDYMASDSSLNANHIINVLNAHHKKIDILAPQVYQVDAKGIVWGSLDPRIIKLTKKYDIKLIPLIANNIAGPQAAHDLLSSPAAEKRLIQSMLQMSKKHGFYGLQIDFEHINLSDKAAFTQFFKKAASIMHKNGYKISVALIPQKSLPHTENRYQRWFYPNWSDSYDLKQLGQAADFATIMTYEQHSCETTPGPIAGIPWMKASIKKVTQSIPANKLFLGIPVYSGLWRTGKPRRKYCDNLEITIGYNAVVNLLKKYHLKLKWSPKSKVPYAVFMQSHLKQYLFVENVFSFDEKLKLAKEFKLKGVAVWKLGVEDPRIWTRLPVQ